MPDPGFEPGAYRLRVGYPAVGRIRRVRQTGFEPAIYGLKAALGISSLEKEMIFIDPKSKPNPENERKIKEFCKEM